MQKIITFFGSIFWFLFLPITIIWDTINSKYNAPLSRRLRSLISGLGAWIISILVLPVLVVFCLIKRKPVSTHIWSNDVLTFENVADVCEILERCMNEKDDEQLQEEWWYFVDDFAGILHLDNDLYEMGQEFEGIILEYEMEDTPFQNESFASDVKSFTVRWREKLIQKETQALH